ncbi:hypothetical protein LZ30DRAFT_715998 [Colletotrichum cereale]|nr:hypothetical protein LZ30DRAFT_715998 [Colletotrichum cereale]
MSLDTTYDLRDLCLPTNTGESPFGSQEYIPLIFPLFIPSSRPLYPSNPKLLVYAANGNRSKMTGVVPAWTQSMPSQWFAPTGFCITGPSELFPQVLCAACIVACVFITGKYNHIRPESSGSLQLYKPPEVQPPEHPPPVPDNEVAEPQPPAPAHEVAEPQLPVPGYEVAEPQPLAPEQELPPGAAIGRSLVRFRIQGGFWSEYDMPRGSELRLNRCSTVIKTKA